VEKSNEVGGERQRGLSLVGVNKKPCGVVKPIARQDIKMLENTALLDE